jgi:hypothetical protein
MNRKKPEKTVRKGAASLIRSSAAEYLSFIVASGIGSVEAAYADESVWFTQKMMGLLYGVDVRTINYRLKKVFSDSELQEDSVIQNFRITAADGKSYDAKHYNLTTIVAIGCKVNSERAVQFRKWANTIRAVHAQWLRDGRRAPEEQRLGARPAVFRGTTATHPRYPPFRAQALSEDHRHLRHGD